MRVQQRYLNNCQLTRAYARLEMFRFATGGDCFEKDPSHSRRLSSVQGFVNPSPSAQGRIESRLMCSH